MGLNRQASITDNIIITRLRKPPFAKGGLVLDEAAAQKTAEELVKEYDVRPPRAEALTSSLSGGNAQKVVVAREVTEVKKLLIASQPTRGIDIGAIESIRTILQRVKAQGIGVLLVSAELEEILSLSDRIVVLSEGRIAGTMPVEEANEENLGMLMLSGGRKEETAS